MRIRVLSKDAWVCEFSIQGVIFFYSLNDRQNMRKRVGIIRVSRYSILQKLSRFNWAIYVYNILYFKFITISIGTSMTIADNISRRVPRYQETLTPLPPSKVWQSLNWEVDKNVVVQFKLPGLIFRVTWQPLRSLFGHTTLERPWTECQTIQTWPGMHGRRSSLPEKQEPFPPLLRISESFFISCSTFLTFR